MKLAVALVVVVASCLMGNYNTILVVVAEEHIAVQKGQRKGFVVKKKLDYSWHIVADFDTEQYYLRQAAVESCVRFETCDM